MRQDICNTGVSVSPVGLGTVKFGRNQMVKYPAKFMLPTDEDIKKLLSCAKNIGVNLIDTAPAYGISEERLGRHLYGQRNNWVLSTKVGETFKNGQSYFDFSPKYIQNSIRESLKRLKTDYIDILFVHSDGNDVTNINEYGCLDTLNDIKKQGLIRATGMSVKTVDGGLLSVKKSDVTMVTWNLHDSSQKAVLDLACQINKPTFIKKVFSSGHLIKKEDDSIKRSIKFLYSHPGVTSAILGTINSEHLQQNIEEIASIICAKTSGNV